MRDELQLKWNLFLTFIRDNTSDSQYKSWFEPIKPVSLEGNNLTIEVPTNYYCEFLEANFLDLIIAGILKTFGKGTKLNYYILTDNTNGIGEEIPSSPDAPIEVHPIKKDGNKINLMDSPAPQELDARLNPRYNFNTFIEGESNQLSRTVAKSVAENPSKTPFNPLFIFGPSGVGKTHLINAIGTETKTRFPHKRVLYVSAHLFMVQYTDAVSNNTRNDFINFYQSIDVLIVDDMQEIAGNKGTQNVFFHIFNHLHLNGKQLILAADRKPSEMQGFEDRLLTRFKWGMVAELERPDEKLRKSIMMSKVRRDGLSISEDVISYIAETVNESVRDLEGIINALMAYSIVYNSDIDMALARKVLSKITHNEKKPVTVEDILNKTCGTLNVKKEDIFSRSRKRPIALARQISMYLAQKYTTLPISKIGVMIGSRNHATVIHSINIIKDQMSNDQSLQILIKDIESSLKE